MPENKNFIKNMFSSPKFFARLRRSNTIVQEEKQPKVERSFSESDVKRIKKRNKSYEIILDMDSPDEESNKEFKKKHRTFLRRISLNLKQVLSFYKEGEEIKKKIENKEIDLLSDSLVYSSHSESNTDHE